MKKALLAAALLAASTTTSAAAQSGPHLSAADLRLVQPVVVNARGCLGIIARYAGDRVAAERYGNTGEINGDADEAGGACLSGQRADQQIRQRYPTRARSGRLRLVLARADRLFAGALWATRSAHDYSWQEWNEYNTVPLPPGTVDKAEEDSLEIDAGVAMAENARAMLAPDLGSLTEPFPTW